MVYVLGNGYLGEEFIKLGGVYVDWGDFGFLPLLKDDVVINCIGDKECGWVLASHFANVFVPMEAARICERTDAKFIHFSSAKAAEYTLYSRQKNYIDYIIPLINNNYTIYKLSMLFGKDDFTSKAIGLMREGKSVPVYNDLISPTYYKDVINYVYNNLTNHKNEMVELANQGRRTRAGYVKDLADMLGLKWDTHYIGDDQKYDCSLEGKLRPYEEALKEYIDGLV